MGADSKVEIEPSNSYDTFYEILESGLIEKGFAHVGFKKSTFDDTLKFKNPFVLLLDDEISDFQPFVSLLKKIKELKRSLMVVCKDMTDEVENQFLFYKNQVETEVK